MRVGYESVSLRLDDYSLAMHSPLQMYACPQSGSCIVLHLRQTQAHYRYPWSSYSLSHCYSQRADYLIAAAIQPGPIHMRLRGHTLAFYKQLLYYSWWCMYASKANGGKRKDSMGQNTSICAACRGITTAQSKAREQWLVLKESVEDNGIR